MKTQYIIFSLIFIFACNTKPELENTEVKSIVSEEKKVEKITVKGTVYSSRDSIQISGAMIIIPGTTIGTMTDQAGNFMIGISGGVKKLSCAAKGYISANVEIDREGENFIYLEPKPEN